MDLTRGQRAKITDLIANGEHFRLGVAIQAPGLSIDVACFGLDAAGKLADERYMTFFNQPTSPCGGVRLSAPAGAAASGPSAAHAGGPSGQPGDQTCFDIDLGKLPPSIERLTITAAIDGTGAMSNIGQGHVRFLDGATERGRFAFSGADFAAERALMLLEVYRKGGVWRTCAIGQGFNGGLAALVEHFGGTVAEPTPAAAPPQSPTLQGTTTRPPTSQASPPPASQSPPSQPKTPPLNLSKITLEKKGNRVSLEKPGHAEHGEILINLSWRPAASAAVKRGLFGGKRASQIDLDLGCLIELQTGEKGAIQALGNNFGDLLNPPYIALDADDRSGNSSEGENLRINGQHWDAIRRVLIYAFIYEGAPNWAEADARISLKTPGQPEIEVRLDSQSNHQPMCAIALLENDAGAVRITKLVDYYRGHRDVDQAHHWGLRWTSGSKD
ncbi:TerD family protein [Halochromatium roseum]|uniref:TerD family protein n=1 Tax=Halochromatium roseum TaxID=391920 RepID=UPI001913BA09|nr:TerD family protein [Halochromatium roseum]MBK5939349.1 tellurium resistance protein [Halochromatium roseum]